MPQAMARAQRGSSKGGSGFRFMVFSKIDLPQTATGEGSQSSRALGRAKGGRNASFPFLLRLSEVKDRSFTGGHLSGLVSIQIVSVVEVWHVALE
jgi:hypothetical protein